MIVHCALVTALDRQIHLPATALAETKSGEDEMNFVLESGDKSPHSKRKDSGLLHSILFR